MIEVIHVRCPASGIESTLSWGEGGRFRVQSWQNQWKLSHQHECDRQEAMDTLDVWISRMLEEDLDLCRVDNRTLNALRYGAY